MNGLIYTTTTGSSSVLIFRGAEHIGTFDKGIFYWTTAETFRRLSGC